MLRSCLLLIGLPLLAALGLLFFVGIEQTGEAVPYPQPIPPEQLVPSPYVLPTTTPLSPRVSTLDPLYLTATALIRSATETMQVILGSLTPTPTFGSPTALPNFGATSTPFPNPT